MKQSYVRYEYKTNIQEGVKNLFLLATVFCIHSLHNPNHVLVFMQITFEFYGSMCVRACVGIYI
jgi:hypothetical protein